MTGRMLVAGIGNVFLGDDGFGVEVVTQLGREPLPEGVDVMDVGIRGVHLVYQLLEGYDALVLVDAVARGDAPGTVTLAEPASPTDAPDGRGALLDPHRLDPAALLDAARALGASPATTVVVGCEPATLHEGIGLSAVVGDAVGAAVAAVRDLVDEFVATGQKGHDDGEASDGDRRDRAGRGSGLAPTSGHRALPADQADVSVALADADRRAC